MQYEFAEYGAKFCKPLVAFLKEASSSYKTIEVNLSILYTKILIVYSALYHYSRNREASTCYCKCILAYLKEQQLLAMKDELIYILLQVEVQHLP